MVNGPRNDAIKVPAAFKSLRFWRNTSVAASPPGATKTFATGTLGYEWDEDLDNGFRPGGLIKLSSATYDVSPDKLLDFGCNFGNGTATHSLTLYRAPSGALVWGAGTVQWPWGLDADARGPGLPRADRDIRQATVNLLADMGAQPATLPGRARRRRALHGRHGAVGHHHRRPPPAPIVERRHADHRVGHGGGRGGGVVGGVEVSTDGSTWHPASGHELVDVHVDAVGSRGTATLRARATDDSVNIGAPSPPVTVTVGGRACPCTIWPAAAVAGEPRRARHAARSSSASSSAPTPPASITGHPLLQEQPEHRHARRAPVERRPARCWRSATFTGETASGWQQVTLRRARSPIVGQHDVRRVLRGAQRPLRRRRGRLQRRRRRQPAAARAARAACDGPTVSGATSAPSRPTTSPTPTTGSTSSSSEVSAVSRRTVVPLLAPPRRRRRRGSSPRRRSAACPCTSGPRTAQPVTDTQFDNAAVELGVKFRSDTPGFVKGVRFYKGTRNTGTARRQPVDQRPARSWPRRTFTARRRRGWQQVDVRGAGRDRGQHDLRRLVPHGRRLLRVRQQLLRLDGRRRAAAARAVRRRRRRQRRLPLRRQRLPDASRFSATNYWVDVVFDDTVGPTPRRRP